MLKLAPSVLAADFLKLGSEVKMVEEAGAHYLHLDIMDGHFVPNISFGIPIVSSLRPITNMVLDVHLMIEQPDRFIEAFANAGADIINVHVEACSDIGNSINRIRSHRKKAAITVKPKTPIESIYKWAEDVDMILIMSVEPGFGGQGFIENSLRKSEELANFIANKKLSTEIEMDGGIYLDNVRDVINAGVNVVVTGSAVFKSKDIRSTVKEFYNEFQLKSGEKESRCELLF